MPESWKMTRYLVELPDAILLFEHSPTLKECQYPAIPVQLEVIDNYPNAEGQSNGTYLISQPGVKVHETGLIARQGQNQFQQSLRGNDFGSGFVLMEPQPYLLDDWNQWKALNPGPIDG